AAHVLKRQHRDRRLVWEWWHRRDRGRPGRLRAGGPRSDSVDPHRPCDVLDLLLAEILEGEVELVAHLLVRRAAEADAAGLRQRFEPCGDVDPVAEDVVL